MRIQTNIFIWGFFAFLVPLTTLALITSYYSQSRYLKDVEKNVHQSLVVLSSEIHRRLSTDRNLTKGLSEAPAVQNFLSILNDIEQQKLPADFQLQMETVNQFFEGFQTIIPGLFFIRILDSQGNTLIKVSHNNRSPAAYESLQGFSYAEQELNNPTFVQQLKSLARNEVSSIVLPHNKAQTNLLSNLALLDNVIPLYYHNKWVGALSLTLLGEDVDKILNHALRPFDGKLLIVENNPDIKNRHGMILYDDINKLSLSHARPNAKYLQNTELKALFDNTLDNDNKTFHFLDSESTVYTHEFTPYPNQFISWLIAVNISDQTIIQPYAKIRLTIWSVAGLTLLLGLILTHIGARQVTRALSSLVVNFKKYALGDHHQVADTSHCVDEIKDLGNAFNEMTHTLNTAHKERDKAQQMMLQSSKLASIGQMAAGIGHEINNPLNNILSYSKLALRNLQDADNDLSENKRKTLLSDIQSLREETLRASEIVKGIMNFARQVPPHFSDFELKPWIENSLSLVQQTANDYSIHLTLDYKLDTAITYNGDRGQLQQVLVNLLLNAIQASSKNKSVEVSVDCYHDNFKDQDYLMISIFDSGKGIKEEALDLIFDPFFTTKNQGEGTGLGLSISLGIIQDHRGTITITNRTDSSGVIAQILLPL